MTSIRARAPKASSPAVRRVMQANLPRDTKPEVRLRKALYAEGLRFRKDHRPEVDLSVKADIVFIGRRLCIFVDGCFWHGCPQHFKPPKTNTAWWLEKVEDNRSRDRRKTQELEARGWRVLRVWEHELEEEGNIEAVAKVRKELEVRGT